MKKRKVFLKADASSEIGYGHFFRTLALADMLKDDFDCTFFTADPNDFQREEVAKVCKLYALSFSDAIPSFLDLLTGNEIVVLDNYYYTEQYQQQIRNKGCKLVCVDDNHIKHFYAEMVINHTPCISSEEYSCEPYTRLLLGTDFLLLRRDFFDAIYHRKPKIPHSVFICYGGSDEYNLTLQTCKIIRQIDNRPIVAVVGGGYEYLEDLKEYSETHNVQVYSNVNAAVMVDLMQKASLAIVPASCTFFETCCTRVPIITGYTVDNQRFIAKACEELGLGYNCGNLLENFESKILQAISAIVTLGDTFVKNQSSLIKDSKTVLIKNFKLL